MALSKVLHLVEDFKIGGLERIVETIYDGLDRDLYEPHIWCIAAGGELADRFIRQGKSLRVLQLSTYHNPINIAILARFIHQGRFEIVHTHGYFAGTMGRIAAFLAGTPIILHHVHTTYWDFTSRNLFIEKILSTVTARIICCSDFVRNFVITKEKISAAKTIRIYNGAREEVDTANVPEDPGHAEQVVRLAIVASLVENKGHHNLLLAFHKLAAFHPALELWIIGDGVLRESLEEVVASLDLGDKVTFFGIRHDVIRLLTQSDIVVLPSLYREGLSLALIEAMSLGKPVVSTSVGGIPELVADGVNGFVVIPGDVQDLMAKLKMLIIDKDLRAGMGAAGRRIFAEKFAAEIMIKEIENLYRSELSDRAIR